LTAYRSPESLDDLKSAGYLREVPTDPMTQQKDWVPEFGNSVADAGSERIGNNGRTFAFPDSSKFEGHRVQHVVACPGKYRQKAAFRD